MMMMMPRVPFHCKGGKTLDYGLPTFSNVQTLAFSSDVSMPEAQELRDEW